MHSYTLVCKHMGKWRTCMTDTDIGNVKREREALLNMEIPAICYIIKTDEDVEPVQDTVSRFVYAIDL